MAQILPALIFDLDGTLTDSKPGILGCLVKTLQERGMPVPGSLERFIGPPVEEWVAYLLPEGTREEHVALASQYRACYDREGWSNNSVFAGVRQMLLQLREVGYSLYVCTSKHERFAVRIMDAFELSPLFEAIYGDRLEYPIHTKTDLLARVLSDCGLDRARAWMIGDRSFDFGAAKANGVRSMAVGWGYGAAHEWALADAVAATPCDVSAMLSGESRLPLQALPQPIALG
ncbi:MAG TPA: HAD hydrolase-like protein [Terracidiphilus sp.]|jgi:phosphoglycolate phosphatase|nr:HAD hydrolase-like protein [Terracidiphilus sp.]